jgi:hypothetical protein
MHLAAAYFGKAGYSVTNAVNAFIESQTTSGQTALEQYMTSLTGTITESTIAHLDSSLTLFGGIAASSEHYKSAQFNLSIVSAVKTVSLLKTVIDGAGLGTLSSCDINGNGVRDEADAASCALLASGLANPTAGTCLISGQTATWNATADITFSSATGTYRGLTVDLGTSSGTCPDTYKQLLYFNQADTAYYAATTAGTCQETLGGTWPCPVTSNIDLTASLQSSINGSIDALSTAITGTASTDVQQAIQDIRSQACGDSTCTPDEIAAYIQNYL